MIPKKGRKKIIVDNVLYYYRVSGYVNVFILNTETNEVIIWSEDVKPKWNVQITPSIIYEIIKEGIKHNG